MVTPEAAARDMAQLGRQLKAAPKELTKQLRREMRAEAKPTIQDIKSYARAILPNRGGLADRVASQSYGLRSSFATKGVGIKFVGNGKSVKSLKDIDAGRLRHPVFGNRKKWVQQSVTPGFFTGPIEDDVPRIRAAMVKAMEKTANEAIKGVGTG
jgi:hypothetical protein